MRASRIGSQRGSAIEALPRKPNRRLAPLGHRVGAPMRLIEPDWPRHPRVRACVTTRSGGVSVGPYAALNLAQHVADDPAAVIENRARLRRTLQLANEPAWLEQVHGTEVARIEQLQGVPCADASWTARDATPLAILTADCLPVLFANDAGTCIAAAHAGWRGLEAGVLENTVRQLPSLPATLTAWLGPAIGPEAFEVGSEVRTAFVRHDPAAADAFRARDNGRLLCDLYLLARQRLAQIGIHRVYGGGLCTFTDDARFFSFRRDGVCGRMATLVWLA